MTFTIKSSINFRAADRAVEAGAEVGIQDWADAELEESARLVPVDSGTLRASGHVSTDGMRASVYYTTDYASIVHERLDLYHPDGQAKFLENAQDAMRQRGPALVAAQIRRRT